MQGKTALIVGATGLVGHELLKILAEGDDYSQVIALVRNPISIKHEKINEVIIDFNRMEEYKEHFSGVDDVFCCLGTTIKKAKTKDAMFKIDVEYPLAVAKVGKERGAKRFLVVSSVGADPNSKIWYSKIKGTLEEELKKLSYDFLSIIRPSLLLGERNEFRLGESFGAMVYKLTSFLFVGPLKPYRGIEGKTVAKAMYQIAQQQKSGITIYPSEQLEQIGK